MLKFFWISSNIFLIILILIQIPSNTGLESIAGKNDLLGSPNVTNKIIRIVTVGFILVYLIVAFKYNFRS